MYVHVCSVASVKKCQDEGKICVLDIDMQVREGGPADGGGMLIEVKVNKSIDSG